MKYWFNVCDLDNIFILCVLFVVCFIVVVFYSLFSLLVLFVLFWDAFVVVVNVFFNFVNC